MARGRNGHDVGFAVRTDGELDVISRALASHVRDEIILGVVLLVGPEIFVELIIGLDGWSALEGGDGFLARALGRAVVHDRDGGGERFHEQGIVRDVESVMVDLIHIDGADPVHGADEFFLYVPSEIAAVEETKAAVVEYHDHAVLVVGSIGGFFLGRLADDVVQARLAGRMEDILFRSVAAE